MRRVLVSVLEVQVLDDLADDDPAVVELDRLGGYFCKVGCSKEEVRLGISRGTFRGEEGRGKKLRRRSGADLIHRVMI